MIKKAFCVYDSVAKVFVNPFYQATNGEAIRGFGDAVNDPKMGDLNKHPKDFILYEVGTFDDNSGELTSIVPPNRIAAASDFVKVEDARA